MRPLRRFLAVYVVNINLPNVFAVRKNPRKFRARGGRFAPLRLGRGYLGVSCKFSLNLLDLRSNLKAAYQPLRALPSRWLRRCRALRYMDRVARAARR